MGLIPKSLYWIVRLGCHDTTKETVSEWQPPWTLASAGVGLADQLILEVFLETGLNVLVPSHPYVTFDILESFV